MKTLIRLIFFHVACFALGTAVFILLLRIGVFTNLVFFYRGVVLLFAVTFAMMTMLAGLKYWKKTAVYSVRDIVLTTVCFFCFNLVVFTHLPVTADRSISVFLLGYMAKHPDRKFTASELQQSFLDTYVVEHKALEKRFAEQIQSGTIRPAGDNTYMISGRGKTLMRLYIWIADLFGVNKENLSL